MTCPMCGAEVRVVSSDEGTQIYEPIGDARLRQLAGAVIAQAVLTGREDGFHYSVPYGQAGCQALRALSDYLDAPADREQGAP